MQFTSFASSSKGNLYTVEDGRTRLMLECGLPWKDLQKHLQFQTSGIAGCLLSHAHSDHSKSWANVAKAGIDLYMLLGTAEALGAAGHRINLVAPKQQFTIGSFIVLPLKAEHSDVPTLGYLIKSTVDGEKLLFLIDTAYTRYRFTGLNIIAVECNYSLPLLDANVQAGTVPVELRNRIVRSHFSLENVKDFLWANDLRAVREIHLLHLSADNSDAELFKRQIQMTTGKPVFVGGEWA